MFWDNPKRPIQITCEFCRGEGKIIIGKNWLRFWRDKYIICDICKGKGVLEMTKKRYNDSKDKDKK